MSIIVIGRRSYLGGILSKYLAEHDFTQTVSLAEFVQMPIRGTDIIINCAFSPAWYLSDLPEDLGFDGTAAAIVQGAGAVAGPIIAGFAMSALQRGLSHTIIAAQILMAAFGVYRLSRRAAPSALHKRSFVVEPAVPVATTLESAHSRGGSPSKTRL